MIVGGAAPAPPTGALVHPMRRRDPAARQNEGDARMAQTSILGRMGQLVRANINAILDSAEDPEKMLNQMVIDYTNNIREAE
jgi:hypothetical protein